MIKKLSFVFLLLLTSVSAFALKMVPVYYFSTTYNTTESGADGKVHSISPAGTQLSDKYSRTNGSLLSGMFTYGLNGTAYFVDGIVVHEWPHNYETGKLDTTNIKHYKNSTSETFFTTNPTYISIDTKRNRGIFVVPQDTTGYTYLCVIDFNTGKLLTLNSGYKNLYYNANKKFISTAVFGDTLYALTEDQLYFLSLETFKEIKSPVNLNLKNRKYVRVSPDGKKLFLTTSQYFYSSTNNSTNYAKYYDPGFHGVIYDLGTGVETDIGYSALDGDFSLDSQYIYFLDNKACSTKTGYTENGSLYRYKISDGTVDKLSLSKTGCNTNLILSEDQTKAFVQANMSNGINGKSSQLLVIDISNKQMTLTSTISLPSMLPTVIPAALIAEGHKYYKTISFDYNDIGGTDFDFDLNTETYSTINTGAVTTNSDYSDWSTTAQAAITNFSTAVVSPSGTSDYVFGGWFTDSSFTSPADFDATITEDTTYYAKWLHHSHTWSFTSKDKQIKAFCTETENSDICNFNGINNAITLSMNVSISEQLTHSVSPDNSSNKSIDWKSDDVNIATVDSNGKITARAVGSTTVHAYSQDGSGIQGSCTVVVEPKKLEIKVYSGSYYFFYKDGSIYTDYITLTGKNGDTIEEILSSGNLAFTDYYITEVYNYDNLKSLFTIYDYSDMQNPAAISSDTVLNDSTTVYLYYYPT